MYINNSMYAYYIYVYIYMYIYSVDMFFSRCVFVASDFYVRAQGAGPGLTSPISHLTLQLSTPEAVELWSFLKSWSQIQELETPKFREILWMEEILHQLIGGLSHYL